MSINLEKGARADITKGTGIKKIRIGLGWDANAPGGAPFDLDAMVFALNKDGKCATKEDFVFFNNLKHPSGSIVHSGDNLTGAGDGDDEVISIDLDKVPASIEKIAIAIVIFKATERHENFGMVKNAFARVINADDNKEIMKYDLAEDYSTSTTVIVGEIYRKDGEWKFSAIGEGKKVEIVELSKMYGL